MRHVFSRSLIAVLALLTHGRSASAADQLLRLESSPGEIRLESRRASAQLIVSGFYDSGRTRDLTHVAEITASPSIVTIENGRLRPITNGSATLRIRYKDERLEQVLHVSGQETPDPVRFRSDTQAALTKQGCNAGSCHGSPEGKGGFSLSLFGFDPILDHRSLVREGFNRRVNVYEPDESLILRKPMLRVPHVGGKKLQTSDAAHRILRDWIHEGARDDGPAAPRCVAIEILPGRERVLYQPHATQHMAVLARFSDGAVRDVTAIASYSSSNRHVAEVDATGRVTGKQRGQTAINVRFLEQLGSMYLTVCQDRDEFTWPNPPEHNFIDTLVNKRLQLLQTPPSPKATDTVFLRRVYLDLTGLLPPIQRTQQFLADDREDKRALLIDELLESDAFAHFQSLRMADLMQVNPRVLSDGRAQLFASWLSDAVARNMPFDQLARTVLTARGDSHQVAPANYFAAVPATQDVTEATAQLFMGSRIQCAKCHNHPFENWTQDDYYSLGAAFSHLGRSEGIIQPGKAGGMANPRTGEMMKPWATTQTAKTPHVFQFESDAREAFAQWLTDDNNPFFARVEVNRIWAHLLGQGIVEPVDDFRSSNPPSNSALLNSLADEFRQHGYDRKQIFRLICNSQTYQRSTATNPLNEEDVTLFSHARVRLLSAEQLQDAVGYVTGTLRDYRLVDQLRNELNSELEGILQALGDQRADWESSAIDRLQQAPYWHGNWWSLPMYNAANHDAAHNTVFAPEMAATFDPAARFEDGRQWKLQQYRHAEGVAFESKKVGATYVVHHLVANQETDGYLELVADDGMKVWHNGELVYDKIQIVDDIQQRVADVRLLKGDNYFLIKVNNKGGAYHFTFQLKHRDGQLPENASLPELPDHINALLATPKKARSAEQAEALDRYYLERDGRVPSLRTRIANTGRVDYATQRYFPERNDFLKAFGQPERTSPCVCERTSDPTLDQALQMLNGKRMFDQIQKSTDRYNDLDNRMIARELYLAAFSRPPTEKEAALVDNYLRRDVSRAEAITDLVWAVLNTQEFMFQH